MHTPLYIIKLLTGYDGNIGKDRPELQKYEVIDLNYKK